MQPLSNEQYNFLATAAAVDVSYGASLFSDASTFDRDITEYLHMGGSVQSDVGATIHRSCTLTFDSAANLGIDPLVMPWMKMSDPNSDFEVTFNLGLYSLTTPQPDYTYSPATLAYTGYDLLQLLNAPIGDTFECTVGVDPVSIAATLINIAVPNAGVQYQDSGVLTPQVYSWPLDSSNQFTYLTVVNALLKMAGFAPVWVDWNGIFQLRPYEAPLSQMSEWTFDFTSSTNPPAEGRSGYQDVYDVPNWWRFVMNNLQGAPVEGTSQFTFQDDVSPLTSVTARGRTIRKIAFVDAVDYPSLVNTAVQQIELDLFPTEQFTLNIFPLPALWHRDIVTYLDPHLPDTGEVQVKMCMVTNWSLTLDGSADEPITLTTLSPVTDTILQGSVG